MSFILLLGVANAQAGDYARRAEVQTFIDDMVNQHGFDASALNAAFAQVTYQSSVIKAMQPAKLPSVRSWSRYKPRFINAQRIALGQAFMADNAATLRRAEQIYQVPAEVIAGIIGVETVYGDNMGNYRVMDALSTLAFDYPRRADYFKSELAEFLLLCREQHVDFFEMRGSYAGAIGLPQFMPSNIRSLAVDFDGDGKVDVRGSVADAIASVANYFKFYGWQMGGAVAEPVMFNGIVPAEAVQDIRPSMTYSDLSGFLSDDDKLRYLAARADKQEEIFAIIPLESPKMATEYWLGYNNFYVITRYNKSSFYAMSVWQLAQAVKP